ncbi:MAG TPA: 1,4-alpha-glucan branching protein GlgB, partial [Pirellulales bacterium]
MRTTVQLEEISAIVAGRHANPGRILGPHEIVDEGRKATAVRAYLPDTLQAWVVTEGQDALPRPMRRIHPAGVFEAICPPLDGFHRGGYQLQIADRRGQKVRVHDPYAFPPLLTNYDLHLLGEGTHWRSYEKLGAHVHTVHGVVGTYFAVWAPNATALSVIGDFNGWDGRRHPMQRRDGGYWELFIPGVKEGALYKYRVQRGDWWAEKSDPVGFGAELPPRTASVVVNLEKYQWRDQAWLEQREKRNALDAPISVYEMHLGSWMRDPSEPDRWLSYRELAPKIAEYVEKLGYTHVELLPVNEHPFTGSWGYQPVGMFAPTSRFGSPEDFMFFVDYLHEHNIGVLIDWVPGHFPRDAHGLPYFDGTHLYEHDDPRQGEHKDWGTLIYNYGRWEVRNFLISNALFWLDHYHIDGIRVDAVASMIYRDYSRNYGEWEPNVFGGRENLEAIEFLKQMNVQVHSQYPGAITVAEESTSFPAVSRPTYVGGLGFTYKWNMGWMNDTLSYFHKEPIHRRYHHGEITFSLLYAFHENFMLPLSHDEVVHGKGSLLDKMPGDLWQKFANLRLLFSYMWAHPGKKLLFMGGDFGQWIEWKVEESLQWHLLEHENHQGIQKLVADLNSVYKREPSLHQVDFEWSGFEWIDCHDSDESTLSFIRKAKDATDYLVVAVNLTPVPRTKHRIGVPHPHWYEEIFNSDS